MRGMPETFAKKLKSNWIALVSGPASVLLLYWGSVFPNPVPAVVIWTAGYICLVIAAWSIWRNKDQELKVTRERLGSEMQALRERLKAKVEIQRQAEIAPSNGAWYCRIRVKNLGSVACRFRVELKASDPPIPEVSLPLLLELTHQPGESAAALGPLGDRLVDVFYTYPLPNSFMTITGASYKPDVKKDFYSFTLSAYAEDGDSSECTFLCSFAPGDRPIIFNPTN
jgi:hypothetical protein